VDVVVIAHRNGAALPSASTSAGEDDDHNQAAVESEQ
jgi:hypothetical protein